MKKDFICYSDNTSGMGRSRSGRIRIERFPFVGKKIIVGFIPLGQHQPKHYSLLSKNEVLKIVNFLNQ
jgi:hypothetical protein